MYPKEKLFPISSSVEIWGRIVINKINDTFSSEIDLIFKESRKIYVHVHNYYDYTDEDDLLDTSVQKLSNFLNNSKKNS